MLFPFFPLKFEPQHLVHEKKPAHFAARFSGQLQMSASCGLDI